MSESGCKSPHSRKISDSSPDPSAAESSPTLSFATLTRSFSHSRAASASLEFILEIVRITDNASGKFRKRIALRKSR